MADSIQIKSIERYAHPYSYKFLTNPVIYRDEKTIKQGNNLMKANQRGFNRTYNPDWFSKTEAKGENHDLEVVKKVEIKEKNPTQKPMMLFSKVLRMFRLGLSLTFYR